MSTEGKPVLAPSPVAHPSKSVFDQLEDIAKRNHGRLRLEISHDPGGSGMGFYWCVHNGDWPYCSSFTLEGAIHSLIKALNEQRADKLKKEIEQLYGHE